MCIGIAGTVLQAAGSFMQANAQRQAAFFDAGIARNNQIIADQEREAALIRGRAEEIKRRQALGQLLGQQFVAAAVSGIDPTTNDSFGDIISDTALQAKIDALTVRHNAQLEARRFKLQADQFGVEAAMNIAKGNSINPGLSAATTLIGGLAGALGGGGGGGGGGGAGGGGGSGGGGPFGAELGGFTSSLSAPTAFGALPTGQSFTAPGFFHPTP